MELRVQGLSSIQFEVSWNKILPKEHIKLVF